MRQRHYNSNNIANQTPTELPVTPNFNYSLAKIELTVSDGANSALTATDYADATASIEGMFTQANFLLDDGTFIDFQEKQPVTDIVVEDCILHDSRNDVVKVKPGCKNITIRYNKIYNSGREFASESDFNTGEYNAEGIDNVNGDNMHVHHNYIYDICSTGIYAKDGATDVIIENNRIERTYAGGIMVGFDTSPQYFDITVNPKFYENINGIVRNNLIIDAGWEGINNRIVEIRYVNAGDVYPTRDIPSLDGNPTMNDNCYFVAGKSATFTDNRPTAVEDMDLSAWKSHISGDSGTIEVNPALDAKYMPTNPQCVDMGIQTPLTFI